jgi:hypothetical protein
MTIKVEGLSETLRDLGKIEPKLRRVMLKQLRDDVKPLAEAINNRIPKQPLLDGFRHNGRTAWNTRQRAVVRTSFKKPKKDINTVSTTTPLSVVKVMSQGAAVSIADMAGKGNGRNDRRAVPPQMRRPNLALDLLGTPSRYFWRDIERMIPIIERNIQKTVDDITNQANRELMRIRL